LRFGRVHKLLHDLPHPHRLVVTDVRAEMLVSADEDVVHIERTYELLFGNHDRRARLQRIANPELECRVGIRRRKVGNNEVRAEQLLVHRNIDDARMADFIGALTGVTGDLEGRLDDISVRHVQIELAPSGEIGLLAKPHDHEAGWHDLTLPDIS
jgi:hypothetical protein